MQVKEGGNTAITSANLAATDNDTDDNMLSFVVLRSPQYGEIQVGFPIQILSHEIYRLLQNYKCC